jgi:hypothetical protein
MRTGFRKRSTYWRIEPRARVGATRRRLEFVSQPVPVAATPSVKNASRCGTVPWRRAWHLAYRPCNRLARITLDESRSALR